MSKRERESERERERNEKETRAFVASKQMSLSMLTLQSEGYLIDQSQICDLDTASVVLVDHLLQLLQRPGMRKENRRVTSDKNTQTTVDNAAG